MKCINCSNEIDSKMKAAITNNMCPFCAKQIMDPQRLKQLKSLEKVLGSKRFTNSDDVNKKIRDKVIETLLEHFEFTYINPVQETEDVIVLDDGTNVQQEEIQEEIIEAEELTEEEKILDKAPSRSLQEGRSSSGLAAIRQQAKSEAMAETKIDTSLYREAFNNSGGDVDFSNLPDLDGISQADIAAMMPGNTEMQKKVESLKKLAPKKMNSVTGRISGKNKSISRAD